MRHKRRARGRNRGLIVAAVTAMLVVGGVAAARCLYLRSQSVKARVEIDPLEEAAEAQARGGKVKEVPSFDGEVVRTAFRTREAAALALRASLGAAEALAGQQPFRTVEALSGAVAASGLPPGMGQVSGAPGVFVTPYATLYLRYRPAPIGVEVVSLGREEIDGPALLVRLDSRFGEASGAMLFRARKLGLVEAPAPFADPALIDASVWQQELLREAKMSFEERENLRAWGAALGGK